MTETTDPQAEFTAADLIAALRSAGEERDKLHRKELAAVERIRENADFHLGQEMARRQLAEKETARLQAVVARLRQMTDHWEQQLPEVIRTPAVVSAIRAVLEAADEPSRMAGEAQQPETQAVGDCPYGEGPGDGSGCIKPAGHDGDHVVTSGVTVVPCSRAVLQQPHIPHSWWPQPGMAYVHCPGHSVDTAAVSQPAVARQADTAGEQQ
jgi:hypothetical protein